MKKIKYLSSLHKIEKFFLYKDTENLLKEIDKMYLLQKEDKEGYKSSFCTKILNMLSEIRRKEYIYNKKGHELCPYTIDVTIKIKESYLM